MFALHAVWRADRRLALWAEDAARPSAPEDAEAGLHPFACPPAALRALLAAVGPGLAWLGEQAAEDDTRLLLPTAEGTPLPSPEVAFPSAHEQRSAARLTPWRVPSLLFTPDETAQLLGALHEPDRQAVHPDLPGLGPVEAAYGASLRWLTALHDLAWRMAGRGRVLPGIVLPDSGQADSGQADSGRAGLAGTAGPAGTPGSALPSPGAPATADGTARGGARSGSGAITPGVADYDAALPGSPATRSLSDAQQRAHARWLPAPQAADTEELAGLVAACPPVCRAQAGARRGAGALAEELLAVLVDKEARARVGSVPGVGSLPGVGSASDVENAGSADDVTAAFLAALGGEDGALPGPAARWRGLAERLRQWRAPGEGASAGRLRLGFRLVEPLGERAGVDDQDEGDEDRWWLELLLSPADEPSHVVTAEDLWAGRAGAAVLAESVPAPEGAFVLELRRAARTHPLLAVLAEEGRPQGRWLDRTEVLSFLRDAAPALSAAGFEVLLPSWWREPPSLGLLLAARPAQVGVVEQESTVGREELLAFQWQLALGGEPLTAEELTRLTAAKDTLVQLRGRWLVADPERLAAATAFLAREGSGEMAASQVLGLMLDAREPAGLPVLAVDVEGPLRALATRLSGELTEAGAAPGVRLPAGFTAELRPYQHDGVAWLAELARLGLGGVLADDMGLGKTVQTLALLAAEYAGAAPPEPPEPPGAPTLVVVPMSLLGNWQRECARFAPMLRVHVHHGAKRGGAARVREAALGADVVLTTYGLAARDFRALRLVPWHRVVADEAQHLKNAATLQSRAVRALPAAHRIALTGTPVENRLADLHSLLDFVNPGLFGTAEQFKERYSVAIERNASVRATALLRRRTEPFVLRRVKTDPAIAAELPRKQEMTVLCNLTVEQAALYRAVVTRLLQRIKGMGYTRDLERRGSVLAALTRLKQICDHPALFTGEGARGGAVRLAGRSGKVALLEEILEEALAEGDSALCFTQYAQFGKLLQPYLRRRLDARVRFLHGGVPAPERQAMVDAFQEDDEPSVFLLSLKAGGTGLNLTAANQVVHLDRWWNPAVEEQATDRAFRIGQRRDVQVRRLVSVGTVEERIDELLTAKRMLADAVIGEGLPANAGVLEVLTALAPDALADVLSLAEEAVSEL